MKNFNLNIYTVSQLCYLASSPTFSCHAITQTRFEIKENLKLHYLLGKIQVITIQLYLFSKQISINILTIFTKHLLSSTAASMSCRDDNGVGFLRKKLQAIKDIKLIWALKDEALETYFTVFDLNKEISNETDQLTDKLVFALQLLKYSYGCGSTDDSNNEGEDCEQVLKARDAVHDAMDKGFKAVLSFYNERHRLTTENKYWQDFVLDQQPSYDVLEKMKVEDRKRLLRECKTCLS